MAAWISVKRKMKSFQLTDGDVLVTTPPICPNCGDPATVSLRYGYMGPISRTLGRFFGGASYAATFGYCKACADQAQAAMAISNSFRWFTLLGLFLGACIFVGLQRLTTSEAAPAVGFGIGAVIGASAWWAYRSKKKRNHPRRETQGVWGPAAFYAGTKFLGVREDWVRNLVKLNPELFDDAVREKWAGGSNP